MIIGSQNTTPGRVISNVAVEQPLNQCCSGGDIISGLFASTYIHDQAIPSNF